MPRLSKSFSGHFAWLGKPVFNGKGSFNQGGAAKFSLSALALGILLSANAPAFASGFQCPELGDLPTTALEAKIDTLLPKGGVLAEPAELYEAAVLLRDHGMTAENTINHLVALYCPSVASDSTLSDDAKTNRVRVFAAEATQLVLQEGETEEILYTVKLVPDVADRVEDLATRAGLSVEDWIKKIVTDNVE
ncbi:hypothetical protein [Aliirhizobium cellulosilyticum]|uniref:Glutelin n=1 Tax=Aliirhizobium cellulosilyticum TaxID=393664 RepID=A0A7W6S8X0_9HYPH|nr:hypothetical protein [Rhizobium cellulosilyticum]MBB4349386.1 hypothetical protein [Rhizobium cellulosilyticum]MBB4412392.1 hypothetical protein [Rhizobium cellulosilyticum]MBB4447024.1 hypothetical protein [Rhizobium cellulosilyticum]